MRSKKWFLLYIAAAVIVIGGFFIIKQLGSSTNGTITPPSAAKPAPVITQKRIVGKYIAFDYPSNFGTSPTDKPGGLELETFAYIKRPSPFYFLNITVGSLPSGNLNDDGSYNARVVETDHYSQSHWLINGQGVEVFSDKTVAYGKVAFIVHGSMDASVALSSSAGDDALDQILTNVLKSLSWN